MVTACAAAAEQTNSTATAAELNTTRGMHGLIPPDRCFWAIDELIAKLDPLDARGSLLEAKSVPCRDTLDKRLNVMRILRSVDTENGGNMNTETIFTSTLPVTPRAFRAPAIRALVMGPRDVQSP